MVKIDLMDVLDSVVCMDALVFLRALPAESVDLVVTDPPYPIDRENGSGKLFYGHKGEKTWFENAYDEWPSFWDAVAYECARVLKPGGHFLVFSNEGNLWPIRPLTEKAAPVLEFKSLLVWHKGSRAFQPYGMGYHYRKSCEYVLLWSKGKSARQVINYGTLMQFSRNEVESDHPTPKPVKLLKFLIENSTEPGCVVLDPFAGSGSAAVACLRSGRHFLTCDVSEKWCVLARQNLAQKNLEVLE